MLLRLILLFTLVPFIELWLLLRIGHAAGPEFALGLVIGTGVVGAALARRQGLQTWLKIQREMAEGRPPTGSLVDGFLILIAGALLITPGVLTDFLGFSLLVPPIRSILKKRMAESMKVQTTMRFQSFQSAERHEPVAPANGQVIDVEFERHESDDDS